MKLPDARSTVPWFLAWPLVAILATLPATGPRSAFKLLLILPLAAWGWRHWNRPAGLFPAGAHWLPIALSLSAVCAFAGLGILEFANYSNYDQGDISYYLSSFHNSRGWLPGVNGLSGRPFLAHHSEFPCIPVGWLYRLAPWPITLQLLQAAMALLAWALFRSWILKRSRDKLPGEWLAFGFALTPCLLAPLLKGFHGAALALPALVLTATAFHDRNWKRFLIGLCLLLLCKEVFTLSAMALGAFAWVRRREAKWIAVPFAMGLGYGLFLRGWFFPRMLQGSAAYYYDSLFGGWGEAWARIRSWPSALYLIRLVLWGGAYAALPGGYPLLALPTAGLNLVLGSGFADFRNHYILEPSFWMFFGGALGLSRSWDEGRDAAPDRERRLFSFLLCLFILGVTLCQDLPLYRHHRFESSYRRALQALPAEATVGLGVPLEDHLYKVRRYYWARFGYRTGKPCTWAGEFSLEGGPGEYALLHKGMGVPGFLPREQERIRECWADLEKDPAYRTVWEDPVLILIRKRDALSGWE
ncbi:MAG TPA: DUF2079 domain-containing protein [Fibrobacteria bacterium]|nr:DUF2079 domain-containing protein [Fibrobacteria bacterium]